MQTNNWTYQFLNTTTFVAGNRKNAGKTTLMNFALGHIRKYDKPALCTIGIDGESNDRIDGRAKPLIHTLPGDGVVTTYPMLRKSNGLFKIHKAFPYHTVLGQIVVATTLREGNVELVGPENNTQLNAIIKFLNTELLFKTVIIDGAASRLTPVGAVHHSAFFYLVSIDKRNLTKALDTMKLLSLCSKLDKAIKSDTALDETFKIDGALTPGKLSSIPRECKTIVVDNLSSVFLTYTQLKGLTQKVGMKVINSSTLNGFIVVLKDIEEKEFKTLYRENKIQTELIINPYVN